METSGVWVKEASNFEEDDCGKYPEDSWLQREKEGGL